MKRRVREGHVMTEEHIISVVGRVERGIREMALEVELLNRMVSELKKENAALRKRAQAAEGKLAWNGLWTPRGR